MKIKQLFKDIPVQKIVGSKEVEVTGVCSNSKCVAPGNLFIALRGINSHGSKFIPEAVASGAVAVLTDIYDPFLENVVQIIHPDVYVIEPEIAARIYPHSNLFMVGITGTNGKTTTSYLVKHLLEKAAKPCGLIGTIECIIGKNHFPSVRTTTDLITNYKLLHEMKTHDLQAVVMEVTSHALHQGRVRSLAYDVAVFTNLTQDHLDYHKTLEEYAAVKSQLFATLGSDKAAVVNADDRWMQRMIQDCRAQVLTYAIDAPADLTITDLILSAQGIKAIVHYQGQKAAVSTSLIGRFNVYNCLAAIAVALKAGIALDKAAQSLHSFKRVPGRLESVPNVRNLNVFVDYAHTDDALKNVLLTLREVKHRKIITVFGCGGDRDQGKRPKMAQVAEQFSDQVILTTDNCRNEDPQSIVNQVLTGFNNPSAVHVEIDRAVAIQKAIQQAHHEDIVLIAGKGHEKVQIFAHQTVHFDDCQVAAAACQHLN
jgi:UDP-N-acetylmuramoyl-L-alanyl-D-glutamate--2,6-diaminopimelate ligase